MCWLAQALDLYTESKVWLGKDAAPANFISETLPKWYAYFTVCVHIECTVLPSAD